MRFLALIVVLIGAYLSFASFAAAGPLQAQNTQQENSKPASPQLPNPQPVKPQPVKPQPVKPQPANPQPTNSKPTNSTPTNAKPTSTKPATAPKKPKRPSVVLYWQAGKAATGFMVDVPGETVIPRDMSRATYVEMIEEDKGLQARCFFFDIKGNQLTNVPVSIKPTKQMYLRTGEAAEVPEVRFVRCYPTPKQT